MQRESLRAVMVGFAFLLLVALVPYAFAQSTNSCSPGWACKDSTYKGYRLSNCSWTNLAQCTYGCSNGTCNSNPNEPSCTAKWICTNSNTKAFRLTNCQLFDITPCSNGCSGGKCLGPPAPTCDAKWVCKDSQTKAYQNGDCSITQKSNCQYGCESGNCKDRTCTGAYFCKDDKTIWKRLTDCSEQEFKRCAYACENGACTEAPPPTCEEKWLCIDNNTLVKQTTDCQYINRQNCIHGCENENCKPTPQPPTCEEKDVCLDDKTKGHQNRDCTVTGEVSCQWGCANGACKPSPCTPGYICVDGKTKAFRHQDCSLTGHASCAQGCINGVCINPPPPPKICTAQWTCKDEQTRAYQRKDCSWYWLRTCQYGCENGRCKPRPNCSTGWYCKDKNTLGLRDGIQNGVCKWAYEKTCPNGCRYGTCSGYTCQTQWVCADKNTRGYQKASCRVINRYSCPFGCQDGKCLAQNPVCEEKWVCKDAQTLAKQTKACTYINEQNCLYGCANAACKLPPTCNEGWVCTDTHTRAYRNKDCSVKNTGNCPNGCLNGVCKVEQPSCQEGWVCYDKNTKAYRNTKCAYLNRQHCSLGCENGACKQDTPKTCTQQWACKDDKTRGLQRRDCSWSYLTSCAWGCADSLCRAFPIEIVDFSGTIEEGQMGVVIWNSMDGTQKTLIQYRYSIYDPIEEGQAFSPSVNGQYLAAILPNRCTIQKTSRFYFRVKSVVNGQAVFSPWKIIYLTRKTNVSTYGGNGFNCALVEGAVPSSDAVESYTTEILLSEYGLGQTGLAIAGDVLIGGCLRNHWSAECAFDAVTLVPIGWVAKGGKALVKGERTVKVFSALGSSKDVIRLAGRVEQLAKYATKFRFKLDGAWHSFTPQVYKRLSDMKLITTQFTGTTRITASYPYLVRSVARVGESAAAGIERLLARGATHTNINTAVKNGADVTKTIDVTVSGRAVRWLDTEKWDHITKFHITENAAGKTLHTSMKKIIDNVADTAAIQKLITNTVKRPARQLVSKSPVHRTRYDKYCYLSHVIRNGYYMVVVVDNLNTPGRIMTAYPSNAKSFNCKEANFLTQ